MYVVKFSPDLSPRPPETTILASVRLGRSDLVASKDTNRILVASASSVTPTCSMGAAEPGSAASNAVLRTDTTCTSSANVTVASVLPAYMGRCKLPSSLNATTSLAMPTPSRAATRGSRSLPTAVEAASSKLTS